MTNETKSELLEVLAFVLGALAALVLAALVLCFIGCGALERAPCPPSALASIDARFAAEAITTCKAEGSTADTCKALPDIRAKYARASAMPGSRAGVPNERASESHAAHPD